MTTFEELGLSRPILAALIDCGYSEPTEIQLKTIGIALSGTDVMASAETGSGKTAAYALPIIDCLQDPDSKPRALVLLPTRELALQVHGEFVKFAKYFKLRSAVVYGGTGFEQQRKSLKNGTDIIIATPGRLLDYMERGAVDLSGIEMLVLDEADRLLDMGFMPQVRRIVTKLTKERQTMMFSATINSQVARLMNEFLHEPSTVRANLNQVEPSAIDQRLYRVHEFSKDELLANLLKEFAMTSVIVFTRTKRKATWVKSRLREASVLAEEIHGDVTQSQREKTLARYRKGAFRVLVATDVAARGLDIPTITHVVNYDLPDTPEDYVHRIGRTGRAGRAGMAVSFVSDEQLHLVRDIEKVIGKNLDIKGKEALAPKAPPPVRRRRVVAW